MLGTGGEQGPRRMLPDLHCRDVITRLPTHVWSFRDDTRLEHAGGSLGGTVSATVHALPSAWRRLDVGNDRGVGLRSLEGVIESVWGYSTLRPLQREAMTAAAAGRDSLVVLPTGGGKSLCYQAPALLTDRLTVVVSPLIALMKDQVDSLLARGVSSAFFNSSLVAADRRRVIAGLRDREYRLLFVAPERFADMAFGDLLEAADVGAFAIDEAHCISHWGHDFRSDYRRMGQLKRRYPNASINAFTATATPRVRDDIVEQLRLTAPEVLVGDFFRPNLHYRVERRSRGFDDVVNAVGERPGRAGIVYCIRRKDVDELTETLRATGVRAVGYHAGMNDAERTSKQDAFAAGQYDVVVATVAFGMGIDRSDLRYVIHAAMPKSMEHYQQETGRAGRDGEPAECILFYSPGDAVLWRSIIERSQPGNADDAFRLLREMEQYSSGIACRHRRLVTYFGQAWTRTSCGACDLCCGQVKPLEDSTITAQKILSCVVRTGQRFGAAYVADCLRGDATERIRDRGHDELSTFGLMPETAKSVLSAWIGQLVDQDLLLREPEYRTLSVTPAGWEVLRSKAEAVLLPVAAPSKERPRRPRSRGGSAPVDSASASTSGAVATEPTLDTDGQVLFEALRLVRRGLADDRNVPAFIVFGDKALRDMARRKPTTEPQFLAVHGVGPAKFTSFGEPFLEAIRAHLSEASNGEAPRE